ncbi:MAG: RHS repeat-associated core domain-containing protein, partial [Chloroflexota bacterium]
MSQVHLVPVDDLDRNTDYTWFVQSESACGDVTTGSERSFSVGNGIVFDPHTRSQDIARDYGQLITMTLRNEDSLTHSLRVTVTHPYPDVIAGFIGAGSIDDGEAYITLPPGQSHEAVLAVHTQDAEQEDYHLTAQATADEGSADEIVDYAHLSLRVLKANNFTMTLVSENPDTLVKTYQVRNLGLPLTDLSIRALDPATGLPARVLIQPTLDHARLAQAGQAGDTLQFEVIPLFSPEDAHVLEAAAQMETRYGLASPLRQTGFDVVLVATVLDTSQALAGTFACQAPDELYAVTLHDVRVSYENRDWYCTNRPNINLNFSTPGNINPADILGATVTTGFNPAPGWQVLPHDVRLSINGQAVGELLNQVPSGSYTFEVDPAFFNPAANPVQPINQTLGLRTTHMNGGHYVVNTASRLDLDLANFTRYVCAENADDAKIKADQGTQPIAGRLTLRIANPPANAELELSQPVTLEAEVNDEVAGATPYPVWAVITYTDHLTNGSPLTESLTLDQEPPQLAAQLDPRWQQPNQPVTITAVVTDSDPVPFGYVRVDLAGPNGSSQLLDQQSVVGQTSAWQTTFQTGAPGEYTATVQVQDRAGNTAGQTLPLTIDGSPPQLELSLAGAAPWSYAQAGTVYYGEGSGHFTVTASLADPDSGLSEVGFPATVDAGQTYPLAGAASATRSYSYTFSAANAFSDTATVTATDRAGNEGNQPFTVSRDVTPPQMITVTVPSAAGLRFSVAFSATDSGAGLRGYNVHYRSEGQVEWTPWLTGTGEPQAEFVGLPGQVYTFRAQAVDNVNNPGAWLEGGPVTIASVTKYYHHGGQRVAMRQGDEVYYLHGDHLGSTSLTTDQAGEIVAQTRYLPYGEERWTGDTSQPTDFTFTGQRKDGFGLMDYNARYYSTALGRFVSPDSMVPEPGNPQNFNRYAYAANNPVRYSDPS